LATYRSQNPPTNSAEEAQESTKTGAKAMQNRYVGDANDFVKYLILRRVTALTTDQKPFRLGVCWYLTDPAIVDTENPQQDGLKVGYLRDVDESSWRIRADRELFHLLRGLLVSDGRIDESRRCIANIHTAGLFPASTVFFDENVPQKITERQTWHQRALNVLEDANIIFLDPDNSVSDLYAHPVRGGKWAAPHEARAHFNESRSVVWISHPRQPRSLHHTRTMATSQQIGSLFCSVYLGHCGFHFLLNETHLGLANALRQFVHEAQDWVTCRYFDSSGESINPNMESEPSRVPDETAVELSGDRYDGTWEYVEGLRVNDPGALWVRHNRWIDPNCCWEVAFLFPREELISRVRFVPFENPEYRYGIRPWNNHQNRLTWQQLSEEASNANQRVYLALVRRVPC
jgi:hypothetical protein